MFSLACSYYAIASQVAIRQGNDPTLWRYNNNELIQFMTDGYKNKKIELIKPDNIVSKN